MTDLIPSLLSLIAGLVLLTFSADRFVASAERIAMKFGISSLVVGITIVGFGTSAPEMLVSAVAALQNRTGIALGNAIGSNIANIGLILGLTALLAPIPSNRAVIRREFPVLLVVTLFASFVMLNGSLSRWEAGVFIALQIIVLWASVYFSKRNEEENIARVTESKAAVSGDASDEIDNTWKVFLKLVLFFALLVASSRILVWSAVSIAEYAGISDLIIGLTIVAIGTSLPELAASVAASRKGLSDMVLGNVLGSNVFNLLSVLGISALIRPQALDPELLWRDLPIMVGVTLLLGGFLFKRRGFGLINRTKGVILLSCYVGYQVALYFAVMGSTS